MHDTANLPDTGTPNDSLASDSAPVRSSIDFPVVGIGASAGGLPALLHFFENMPQHAGMAFVVILHLSPKHKSSADHVLQRATRMPVVQVTGGAYRMRPRVRDPPNRHLTMVDGLLSLTELERPRGTHVAIDIFFRTLAEAHRERAVAIVLSGTGSDGAVGLTRIKEQGGVTIAQLPADAEHEGMPEAAIRTGVVDFVLPVVDMPQKLIELWENARIIELPPTGDGAELPVNTPPPDAVEQAEDALQRVIFLLLNRTGHDFKQYKRATVLRRIERRMQVRGVHTLPEYRALLESDARECSALLDDMLIGVTNFFRDREAFEAIEREIVPELFKDKAVTDEVRVWVAAARPARKRIRWRCCWPTMPPTWRIRRRSRYSPPTSTTAPSPRPDRRLPGLDHHRRRAGAAAPPLHQGRRPLPHPQGYPRPHPVRRPQRAARPAVLAARPGLLPQPADLPEPRRPGPRAGDVPFRAQAGRLSVPGRLGIGRIGGRLLHPGRQEKPHLPRAPDHPHCLLRRPAAEPCQPPAGIDPAPAAAAPVLVCGSAPARAGAGGRALGGAGPRWQHRPYVAAGRPVPADGRRRTVAQRAGADPARAAPGAAQCAVPGRSKARSASIAAIFRCSCQGSQRNRRHAVSPFHDDDSSEDFSLVVFHEIPPEIAPPLGSPARDDLVLTQLETELQRTKEQLQETIEHSEISTEELRASNEELQAINEELRSATEELETSKEELQSVNEELITVNYELKVKVEETGKANDDLNNLIASTDIATVFVDSGLRIKRFTPRATDIFSVIASDLGRSLLDLTHRLDYDELADDVGATFDTLRPVEREVRSDDGRWYIVRLLPYRTTEDRIEGAIMTFFDITARRQAEELARASEARMRMVAESTHDYAIITMDAEGRVTSWNKGAERAFRLRRGRDAGAHARGPVHAGRPRARRARGGDAQRTRRRPLGGRALAPAQGQQPFLCQRRHHPARPGRAVWVLRRSRATRPNACARSTSATKPSTRSTADAPAPSTRRR
jgi:two-component system CheB/CheR fusion protein